LTLYFVVPYPEYIRNNSMANDTFVLVIFIKLGYLNESYERQHRKCVIFI